jgi:hypothetical protein
MKKIQHSLKLIVAGITLVLLAGCVSAPSPGNNADYKRLQQGKISSKPLKKPTYIYPNALKKIKSKTSINSESNK